MLLAHGLQLVRGTPDELVWQSPADPVGAAAQEREIRVPGVATFRVRDGCRVHVARAEGADEAEVQASLEGRVTAALLQQRGNLPLHLAAVVLSGRAVGFAGPPAVGKSSLAGALAERGHAMLTDDLAALAWDASTSVPVLHPGPARVRIWGSSARQLGWPTPDELRVTRGSDKFAYELPDRFTHASHPLGTVYVLVEHPGDDVPIEPIEGFAKFEAYFAGATYNREFLDTPQARAWHFAEVCRLAGQVPTFALGVPAGDLPLARLAAAVEEHAASRRPRRGRS